MQDQFHDHVCLLLAKVKADALDVDRSRMTRCNGGHGELPGRVEAALGSTSTCPSPEGLIGRPTIWQRDMTKVNVLCEEICCWALLWLCINI